MKKTKLLLPILGLSTLCGITLPLVSCGGGGGDKPTPPGPEPTPTEQVTLNLSCDRWATLSASSITVDSGLSWAEIKNKLPSYETKAHVTLDGWYKDKTTKMEDEDVVTSDLSLQARFKTGYEDSDKVYGWDEQWGWIEYSYDEAFSRIKRTPLEAITILSDVSRDEFNTEIFIGSQSNPDWINNFKIFNSPITIHDGLTNIPNYFLMGCYSFNQDLTIPSSVQNIGAYFMANNYHGYKKTLTIQEGVKTIGARFGDLSESQFSKGQGSFGKGSTINLPSTITSIGLWFLGDYESGTGTDMITVNMSSIPATVFQEVSESQKWAEPFFTRTYSPIRLNGTYALHIKGKYPDGSTTYDGDTYYRYLFVPEN